MTQNEYGKACHQIIETDNFHRVQLEELDDAWTRTLIQTFLEQHNLPWQVGKTRVGPGYIIKIDDKYLKYLLTMPKGSYDGQPRDQFYWMIGNDPNNDNHAIHPDTASLYLLQTEFLNTTTKQ